MKTNMFYLRVLFFCQVRYLNRPETHSVVGPRTFASTHFMNLSIVYTLTNKLRWILLKHSSRVV
jgi:hypothetical protein